jgi:hypothetical protein
LFSSLLNYRQLAPAEHLPSFPFVHATIFDPTSSGADFLGPLNPEHLNYSTSSVSFSAFRFQLFSFVGQ